MQMPSCNFVVVKRQSRRACSGKEEVNDVLWNDAKAACTSLLSDPRIVDSDYLFRDNNPFALPPAHLGAIKDVNKHPLRR